MESCLPTQLSPSLPITFFLRSCPLSDLLYARHIIIAPAIPCFTIPILLFPSISYSFSLILLLSSATSLAWSQSSTDEDASGPGIYCIRHGLHTPLTIQGTDLRCSLLPGPYIGSMIILATYDITWDYMRSDIWYISLYIYYSCICSVASILACAFSYWYSNAHKFNVVRVCVLAN